MQMVIDISAEQYELVRHGNKSFTTELELMNAVAKGVPLPKGHGDLIDRNEIGLTNFDILLCNGSYKEALKLYDQSICNALPIIKADVENKNSEDIPMEYFESGGI